MLNDIHNIIVLFVKADIKDIEENRIYRDE